MVCEARYARGKRVKPCICSPSSGDPIHGWIQHATVIHIEGKQMMTVKLGDANLQCLILSQISRHLTGSRQREAGKAVRSG